MKNITKSRLAIYLIWVHLFQHLTISGTVKVIFYKFYRVYNLKEEICNCSYFLAHNYCKHSIATKVDRKLILIPQNTALKNYFGENAIIRPPSVKKALDKNQVNIYFFLRS